MNRVGIKTSIQHSGIVINKDRISPLFYPLTNAVVVTPPAGGLANQCDFFSTNPSTKRFRFPMPILGLVNVVQRGDVEDTYIVGTIAFNNYSDGTTGMYRADTTTNTFERISGNVTVRWFVTINDEGQVSGTVTIDGDNPTFNIDESFPNLDASSYNKLDLSISYQPCGFGDYVFASGGFSDNKDFATDYDDQPPLTVGT